LKIFRHIHESSLRQAFTNVIHNAIVYTPPEGSVGLGLSIAKWAVEMHGGSIAFIDRPGPGSVCRIELNNNIEK
jgi:signal transduction histidine kinase